MTSTWQLIAEGVIGEIPLRLTLGDPPDLTAAPGMVSFDVSSVRVSVCKWDSECGAITPSPTLPHPSPVPTPTRTPDYTLNVFSASIPFAMLALIQVAVGIGLVRRHLQHARAKAKARSEATLSAEKVSIVD